MANGTANPWEVVSERPAPPPADDDWTIVSEKPASDEVSERNTRLFGAPQIGTPGKPGGAQIGEPGGGAAGWLERQYDRFMEYAKRGGQPEMAGFMAGPLAGPVRVAEGLTRELGATTPIPGLKPALIGQGSRTRNYFLGPSRIVSGALQAAGPFMAVQPTTVPAMAAFGEAQKGVESGARALGASPDVQEVLGTALPLAAGTAVESFGAGRQPSADKLTSTAEQGIIHATKPSKTNVQHGPALKFAIVSGDLPRAIQEASHPEAVTDEQGNTVVRQVPTDVKTMADYKGAITQRLRNFWQEEIQPRLNEVGQVSVNTGDVARRMMSDERAVSARVEPSRYAVEKTGGERLDFYRSNQPMSLGDAMQRLVDINEALTDYFKRPMDAASLATEKPRMATLMSERAALNEQVNRAVNSMTGDNMQGFKKRWANLKTLESQAETAALREANTAQPNFKDKIDPYMIERFGLGAGLEVALGGRAGVIGLGLGAARYLGKSLVAKWRSPQENLNNAVEALKGIRPSEQTEFTAPGPTVERWANPLQRRLPSAPPMLPPDLTGREEGEWGPTEPLRPAITIHPTTQAQRFGRLLSTGEEPIERLTQQGQVPPTELQGRGRGPGPGVGPLTMIPSPEAPAVGSHPAPPAGRLGYPMTAQPDYAILPAERGTNTGPPFAGPTDLSLPTPRRIPGVPPSGASRVVDIHGEVVRPPEAEPTAQERAYARERAPGERPAQPSVAPTGPTALARVYGEPTSEIPRTEVAPPRGNGGVVLGEAPKQPVARPSAETALPAPTGPREPLFRDVAKEVAPEESLGAAQRVYEELVQRERNAIAPRELSSRRLQELARQTASEYRGVEAGQLKTPPEPVVQGIQPVVPLNVEQAPLPPAEPVATTPARTAAPAETREPWQISKDEYKAKIEAGHDAYAPYDGGLSKKAHLQMMLNAADTNWNHFVRQAYAEGKPVPPANLAEAGVTPAEPAPEARALEPWQQTYVDWRANYGRGEPRYIGGKGTGEVLRQVDAHEYAVREALKAGKDVPPEVLAEYPGLKEKIAPKAAEPTKAPTTKGATSAARVQAEERPAQPVKAASVPPKAPTTQGAAATGKGETIGDRLGKSQSLRVGTVIQGDTRTPISLRPDTSQPGAYSVVAHGTEGTQSFRMMYGRGDSLADSLKHFEDYLNTDNKGEPYRVEGGQAKAPSEAAHDLRPEWQQQWDRVAKVTGNPLQPVAVDLDDAKRLIDLEGRRSLTGPQEDEVEHLKARIKADPDKWKVGDGVGWNPTGSQINRGYRIIGVDPNTKTVTIRSVANPQGITITGGNDVLPDETVHIADLVRDNKYNAKRGQP